MADNKYNQSLLDMGYTQEQIDSMVNAVSSWQDAMQVVRNVNEGKSVDQPPVAWNVDMSTYKGTDANGNVTTWPWNANLNYNQYWDDSNPNQQSQRGWLNSKYTGEWTSNTYIAYNPDLRTSDLDPNYLYGQAAKDRNRQEAGYIARRNDNIASALYNEWRVSKEDVAKFLASQNEWMNSTEADRLNTIESVWKRLGQIKPQEEEPQKEYDPSIIENALDEDTSGRLYGKVTADEWGSTTGIDTLADANSVYKAMNDGRIANVKALISMKPSDVATSMYSWINPYGEQAWRDVQQYYPEFAADVEAQMKKLKGQENINAMASWWEIKTNAEMVDTNTANTSFAVNNSTNSTSATQLLKSIDSILDSSDSASSAQELMWSIEAEMATLKNRYKNLKNEARSAFKWDAPDYLVKAYMNNKAQEIQNQLSILEDRYNAAYNRYKTEVANAQWQAEYELKKQQLQLQKDAAALEEWATRQWVAIDWAKVWLASSTSTSTWVGTMRTERNNNPTAMTTDYAKMMWLELWVDYEIWDSFVGWDWRTYYTAKFIWDPIEVAIKAFDRWATNNVFAKEWGVLWHWHLWISNQKWLTLSDAEKREGIYKILQKEWWDMSKMAYYATQSQSQSNASGNYNPAYSGIYSKFLQGKFAPWSQTQNVASSIGLTVEELNAQAQARWSDQTDDNNPEVTNRLNAIAYVLASSLSRPERIAATANNVLWTTVSILSSEAWNFAAYYKFIKDNLTFDKLIALKRDWATFWALSDNELRAIGNSASSLNTYLTDDEFYNTLVSIYNWLLWKNSHLTKDEIVNMYNSWNTSTPAPTNNPMNPSGSSSSWWGSSSWLTQ